MARKIDELYEQLKGARIVNSLFTMDGFSDRDYETLLDYLIEEFVQVYLNGKDYFVWLREKALQYYQYRLHKNMLLDPESDPYLRVKPEQLSTRQMLALIRFAVYRKKYSHFKKG